MKDNKTFETAKINKKPDTFNPLIKGQSLPIKKQLTKFLHINLINEKNVFKGLSRFKPEDLR